MSESFAPRTFVFDDDEVMCELQYIGPLNGVETRQLCNFGARLFDIEGDAINPTLTVIAKTKAGYAFSFSMKQNDFFNTDALMEVLAQEGAAVKVYEPRHIADAIVQLSDGVLIRDVHRAQAQQETQDE